MTDTPSRPGGSPDGPPGPLPSLPGGPRRGRPDARGDGDGWVECAQGHRHWGRFGAAGLLLHRPGPLPGGEVLLQHRATWSHHGGTWGLLGGARHRGEDAVGAALREAGEEGGLDASSVRVHGSFEEQHGGWSYATVLARATAEVPARPTGGESIDVAWVGVAEVAQRPLHPGFAGSWPVLRDALTPLHLVVDAANVVGSRPDGWWRDRAGAARRLLASCERLARRGLAAAALPPGLALPPLAHWWPRVTVVLEGAAREAADAARSVAVRAAPASGDDTVVEAVRESEPPVLVVTADRGLRSRVEAAGARTTGPRWLTDLLDP